MLIDSVVRDLKERASPNQPPLQEQSITAEPQHRSEHKRVDLHYVLDLWLNEECPHCGHKMIVTSNNVSVVKGYSYEKKQKVANEKVITQLPKTENQGVIDL